MTKRAKYSLYIVIIGCGRLGSYLANGFSREGHSVVVIDSNETTFDNLTADFSGFKLEGDATKLSVLKKSKLNKADCMIAATHDDNVNLMAAQVAKKIFNVPKVLARVFDPKREQVYAQLGIETICPTSVAAELFFRAVNTPSSYAGDHQ
jgi:trk system potassium uptake protein TrkA